MPERECFYCASSVREGADCIWWGDLKIKEFLKLHGRLDLLKDALNKGKDLIPSATCKSCTPNF